MPTRTIKKKMTISVLSESLAAFAAERNWDQFHSPKNLSVALQIEAAELAELFLWSSDEQSYAIAEQRAKEIRSEIADVFIFLIMLARKTGCDPLKEAFRKMKQNEERYPIAKSKGNARKYTEF